jgi:DNA-binding transcriptional LysR family regulator
MDRVSSMTTFVRVVDTGGFAAAARVLSLSPSVVTNHVQSLEERLGVRLLHRTTRKINLTEVVHAYYDRCVQILRDLDQAEQVIEGLQVQPQGTLRLNISTSLAPILAPVISKFVSLYPGTSVCVVATGPMLDLIEQGFDLAMRTTPTADSSLIVRRLASYRFVVCGSREYLATHGTPEQLSDFVKHNCMTYIDSAWGTAQWGFQSRMPVTGNLQTNSAVSLLQAAVLGQGLIYVPIFVVQDELKSGQLVTVLTQFPMFELSIDAIYPHRQFLPAKVRRFIDLAAEHFHETRWVA